MIKEEQLGQGNMRGRAKLMCRGLSKEEWSLKDRSGGCKNKEENKRQAFQKLERKEQHNGRIRRQSVVTGEERRGLQCSTSFLPSPVLGL